MWQELDIICSSQVVLTMKKTVTAFENYEYVESLGSSLQTQKLNSFRVKIQNRVPGGIILLLTSIKCNL
jgi:hypothetical protein